MVSPLDPGTERSLKRLTKTINDATAKREHLIREALAAGGGLREVARAAGIDHSTLHARLKKEKP